MPPSSKTTFLRLESAAARWIRRPVRPEPVKVISLTSMWCASVVPEMFPWPDRTLMTPGGNPARWISCASFADWDHELVRDLSHHPG